MRRPATFLFVAAMGLLAGSAPVWSEQGPQRFILITSDPTADTGTVVAIGPIAGVGRFEFGGQGPDPFPGQFVFDEGSLFLTITPNPPSMDFDLRACLLRLGTSGTFEITDGTGAFSGAQGDGQFVGRAVVRFSRNAGGQCQLEQPPVFFTGIVQNAANVTVPG